MEFCKTDSQELLLQIRRQEELLKSKRRWLLGLPTSVPSLKHFDHSDFLNKKNLPESLLREDDVFYETVKTRVEEAFGALNVETSRLGIPVDQMLDTCKVRKLILSCLNDLSTNGLYLLAVIFTEDSVRLEKTRCKLKRVIKEFIPKVLRRESQDCHQLEIVKRLAQLLNDPKTFRRGCRRGCAATSTSSLPSLQDAASQVLYRLGDLPTQGLIAMHRKLSGVRVMPQMKRHKHGWGRDRLINVLTKISKKMLSSLREGDKLQESLAKAMAMAELSLKLVSGHHNSSIIEFYPFSPQIKTLHNEIVKAIWFVRKKSDFRKLKQLKSLLDPDSKVPNRCLRTAIKQMLIDYLFECCDMDAVPKSLLKALAMINADSRSASHSFFSQDETEEEVECVFSLSAQMKQVVWDLLPNREFEHEFVDAYMEELEESDDDFDDDGSGSCDGGLPRDDNGSHSFYVEGMGESMPGNLGYSSVGNVLSPSQASMKSPDVRPLQCSELTHFTREGSLDSSFNFCSSFMESKVQIDTYNLSSNQQVGNKDTISFSHHIDDSPSSKFTPNILLDKSTIDLAKTPCLSSFNMSCAMPQMEPSKPSPFKNQYLMIQEACDGTSMIAYNFIGRLLEEFAKSEGVDLDWCANLYLSTHCSIEEDLPEVEQTHTKAKRSDSVIIQVCEELIPSLSESGTKRLQLLLGL
ncbi:uncharacterized protein LOC111792415 isoform X1 [Cucurbita pepo subsp. pepo]|uniref:uncharacterized protein LOC111792415 isoform X1 n=2 Tax=Cucurbita pepo subsp. pepo TaxID=3664 RepID=UPI000C9D65E2|nr:uncharacterized protein LOC111792415 isoform X1 [Cucurbita pepo subsp. pepo]XP_023529627.1 uncharacterized protein LOC111792415 isoform X1 [Cucurbita pepo subsp. pepo]XP_023529628.1 uncharacterized protein LOC111792415 isoform X1 [Cucurbita pepo subsp. pepo]